MGGVRGILNWQITTINMKLFEVQIVKSQVYGSPNHAQSQETSSGIGWDAGSLIGDIKTRYAHLARFARYALLAFLAIFQEPRMRQLV
jgi:hypothetical protein